MVVGMLSVGGDGLLLAMMLVCTGDVDGDVCCW